MSSDIYRDSIFWVEVERIKPNPYQPRREFDELKLNELAESIRMYGLLQPLTVTRKELPREDGGIGVEYELIAGERRLRASKIAGLSQVPVIIRTGEQTDQMKLELAIIENLQREDLNPVDRAKAFHQLHKEFSFTHAEIGKRVGRSREYVSNTLRLLALPEDILQHLLEGRISEGHARPLLMLNHKPQEQQVLLKEVVLKKLNVREAESLARRSAQEKVTAKYRMNPEMLELERSLTERLGTRVTIEPREVGGRLVISFFSANDLEALLDAMRVEREQAMHASFDGSNPTVAPSVVQAIESMSAPAVLPTDEPAQSENARVEELYATPEPVAPEIVESGVEPSADRPMPIIEHAVSEPAPAPVEERPNFVDAAMRVFGAGREETPVPAAVTPALQPVVEEKRDENEPDLYSIRNFSI